MYFYSTIKGLRLVVLNGVGILSVFAINITIKQEQQ